MFKLALAVLRVTVAAERLLRSFNNAVLRRACASSTRVEPSVLPGKDEVSSREA